MTLSTSRQQFLAHETHTVDEDIEYDRKGGIFISHCVCCSLVVLAIVIAALVGIIVYFITFHKLTQKPDEYWNSPDHQALVASGVRLPSEVVPSFYRLKIKANLDTLSFAGDVYITIRASRKVKEIILHSKHLNIGPNPKLTEQIYEKVETLQGRAKRDVEQSSTSPPVENKNETKDATSNPPSQSTETALNTANITETSINSTTSSTMQNISNASNSSRESSMATESSVNVTSTSQGNAENISVGRSNLDTQVTTSSVRNIKIISISEASGDRLILTLASALKPNVDYILELSFQGNISNSMTGFYKSTYKNEKQEQRTIAATQFEPTSARSAFPCFDEPAFKAQFEISIAHIQNMTVLSNMKVSAQEPMTDQPGWQWTHFERSVKMSTYLVAYVLCDFVSIESSYVSKDNITKPVKVWVRPELLQKARYALTITTKLLEYYEDLFGVPYALDKVDLIGIPDFSSGAMENWGLITFREPYFLVDEGTSTVRERMQVGIAAAHELAHQWFGNLVTMRWWTDLWLNEGFATYIEFVGFDHVEPELHMLEEFSRDKMDLLRPDSLRSTQAVSRAVTDAADIAQKFNELSYQKGANLIRMLNHTISETLFRKGLVHYLNKWKYSNAEENDLWEAMSTATKTDPELKDRSIVTFMNSWTRQAGYPVVNVIRNYDAGDAHFEQRLFSVSSEPHEGMVKQIWQLPISYTSMSAPATRSTKPKLWLTEREITSKIDIASDQALYVNVGAIGYYRVNYDKKNWQMLSEALKNGQVTSAITRAQLIDDAFNLAKASLLSYSEALSLTTYAIDGEESKAVWDTILTNMGFLKTNLAATAGYTRFQDYVRLLIGKQLAKLKYGLERPRDDNEALLVEGLVSWDCEMESPRCRDWATHEFNIWMNTDGNGNPIPAHLRLIVYDTALRYGGRREFEFVLSRFYNTTDPSAKERLIASLPSVRDEALITTLLEKSLSEIPKQYAVAVWSTAPSFAAQVARKFLQRNFHRVYKTFTGIDEFMFRAVLDGSFDTVNTQEDLDQLLAFARQHAAELKPMSQSVARLVDTAALRVRWFNYHADTINKWLDSFLTNYTTPAIETTTSTSPSPPTTTQSTTPPPSSTSSASTTAAPLDVTTVASPA